MSRWVMAGVCLAVVGWTTVEGQAPGSIDAEGNRYFDNGMGRYPLQRKGVWKVEPVANLGGGRATAAEVQEMTGALDGLSAVLRATPEAGRLVGYWMKESRTYGSANAADAPPEFAPGRLPLTYSAGFYPFYLEEILDKGRFVPMWSGETESVYFWFNRLPGAMGRTVIAQEDLKNGHRRQIYLKPRVTGTYQGYPVVEKQDLVITREGREPWAAVSVREALGMTVKLLEADKATAENRLAQAKKKNDHVQSSAYEAEMRAQLEKYYGALRTGNPQKWEMRVKGMERELSYNREQAAKAANPQRDRDGWWYWNPVEAWERGTRMLAGLSGAEGDAPACYVEAKGDAAAGRYQMRGAIEKAGSNAGCEAVVKDNWGYFEAGAGRARPQILVVRSIGRCGEAREGRFVARVAVKADRPSHGCARHPVIWGEMDWGKVGVLIR